MNAKLTITAGNLDKLHVPAKVATFLTKALNLDLTVEQSTTTSRTEGRSSYIVSSPNPIDDWQLWLYHTSGRNGGRLELVRYAPVPTGSKRKSATTTLTRQQASIMLDDMGESLQRHIARQRAAHAVDLNAVQPVPAPAVNLLDEAAKGVLGALKSNARFAIRVSRGTTIPRNTPAKVRVALAARKLITPAGGALTDLGRAVRSLIVA